MVIGNLLSKRMNILNINIEELSEKSFVEKEVIENILENNIEYETINSDILESISQILYCNNNYFTDEQVRENDFINIIYSKFYQIKSKEELLKILHNFGKFQKQLFNNYSISDFEHLLY